MTDEHRRSLRWVELIVVSLVVVMLLALLVCYLNRSDPRGGPSRRFACQNCQKQFTLALLRYESRQGHFPGYRNYINDDVQGTPVVASWVVMLFPHLEQNPLWESWNDPQVLAEEKPLIDWELFACPSDPAAAGKNSDPTSLSYVVNCGKPGDADTPAEGVFHDHAVKGDRVLVSVDYLTQHDGATYTLLVSENIQAGLWTDTDEANVGMVWRDAPGACSRINACKDVGDRPKDLEYARPSSNHPGGVNAMFCDGHGEFLSQRIEYEVYQHLMTPNGQEAGLSGELDPADP
jgi:prepilin-type processing-associated H-X9-DG protein